MLSLLEAAGSDWPQPERLEDHDRHPINELLVTTGSVPIRCVLLCWLLFLFEQELVSKMRHWKRKRLVVSFKQVDIDVAARTIF